MRLIFPVLGFFLIVSCSTVRVSYDYDKQVDFSRYKTYNYYSDMVTGLSELDNNRLMNSFDDLMSAKGLSISADPDFYVNVRSEEYDNPNAGGVGVSMGGTGRNVGGGMTIGMPLGRAAMTRYMTFAFIDEDGVGLFWQAQSESGFNLNASPAVRDQQILELVKKVLDGFPPKDPE